MTAGWTAGRIRSDLKTDQMDFGRGASAAIAACGPYSWIEQPAAFWQVITTFLDQRMGSSSQLPRAPVPQEVRLANGSSTRDTNLEGAVPSHPLLPSTTAGMRTCPPVKIGTHGRSGTHAATAGRRRRVDRNLSETPRRHLMVPRRP